MLIESEDWLIAATALANQMKLATGNVKHFNRIDGLELVVDDKFEKFIWLNPAKFIRKSYARFTRLSYALLW